MSYLGENNLFSFRDNFCEPIAGKSLNSASAAQFGRTMASEFNSAAIGCADEKLKPLIFAVCSGIAECGGSVYMCENIDMPSFRHGFPLTGAKCGIYISGADEPHFSFFNHNGFPVSSDKMKSIMQSEITFRKSVQSGKITSISSFHEIYTSFLRENTLPDLLPVNAGISCGNRYVRRLWQEFFTDSDDTLIFQVSDNGDHVNAYSSGLGFISYDRLILAYCIMLWKNGQAVYLPEHFHYAADETAQKYGYELIRFDADKKYPDEAGKQRFLKDALFMCIKLSADRNKFTELIKETPSFASSVRQIPFDSPENFNFGKSIIEPSGRVIITASGKNRLSLVAQSYDAETAAELCSFWDNKLRRMGSCTNFFN